MALNGSIAGSGYAMYFEHSPINKLTQAALPAFINVKPWAVILLDAPWDKVPGAMIRPRFQKAVEQFSDRVNFGEVDIDEEQGIALETGILNIPAVAYYRNGELIAALISATQNVSARTQALIDGKFIGRNDGWDRSE